MKWNLRNLNNLLRYLNDKRNHATSKKIIEYIDQEISMVKSMIDFILYRNKKGEYNIQWIVTNQDIARKEEFLTRNLAWTSLNMEFLLDSKRLPLYTFYKSAIEEKEFIRLVEQFLNTFPIPLADSYEKMRSKEAINISNTPFYDSTCLGITSHLPSFDISYINATFKNSVEYASYLPHEIAHAYQFDGTSYEKSQTMSYSVFREAFPYFVELAFIDYLKHTKYFKAAMHMERVFIESMASTYEVSYRTFGQTFEVKAKNAKNYLNDKGDEIYVGSTSRFLSKLLACYLIQEYRKNEIDTIKIFDRLYHEQKEYGFYNAITGKKVAAAVKGELDSYNRDFHNRKKFEIIYK